MADSFTQYFGFVLPEVGASRDTWGSKENTVIAQIDQLLAAIMPVGAMLDYGGGTVPMGWLLAAGQAVSRQTYVKLFNVIGGQFGIGDGSTTFNLPNTIGRSTVAAGDNGSLNFTRGQLTGAYWVTLGQGNMPNYQLAVTTAGTHTHSGYTSNPGDHSHTGYTDYQGDHAHGINAIAVGPAPGIQFGPQFGLIGAPNTTVNGGHTHNIQTYGAGNHTHSIQTYDGQGGHSHDVWLNGSGQGFSILNPILAVTKMIWCGVLPPAAATTLMPRGVVPADIERGGAV